MKFKAEFVVSPSGTWKILVVPEDECAKGLITLVDPLQIRVSKLGAMIEISVLGY